jgi:hypothetical protein
MLFSIAAQLLGNIGDWEHLHSRLITGARIP